MSLSTTDQPEAQLAVDSANKSPIKPTPVIKIQNESLFTPVSSGAEDEDVKPFSQVLKEDPTWREPSEDLCEKIRDLLEMYFSDENLAKVVDNFWAISENDNFVSQDKFLLKHVRRNSVGFVSVKLLTSFKKLKSLTKADWKLTAYSITKSSVLQLHKSGEKVRRVKPLPEIDLPVTSVKTILFKPTSDVEMDELTSRFSVFGKLATIRKVPTNKEVPLDLRNHVIKHPELGTTLCVIVEYEKSEDAQMAQRMLTKEAKLKPVEEVFSLLGSGRNPRKQAAKQLVRNRDGCYDNSADESSPCVSSREGSPMLRRKNNFYSPKSRSRNGSRDVSPESGRFAVRANNKFNVIKSTSPLVTTHLSPDGGGSGRSTPRMSSPWMSRRYASADASPVSTPGSSPAFGRKNPAGIPQGVVRLPDGPPSGKIKGFQFPRRFQLHSAASGDATTE